MELQRGMEQTFETADIHTLWNSLFSKKKKHNQAACKAVTQLLHMKNSLSHNQFFIALYSHAAGFKLPSPLHTPYTFVTLTDQCINWYYPSISHVLNCLTFTSTAAAYLKGMDNRTWSCLGKAMQRLYIYTYCFTSLSPTLCTPSFSSEIAQALSL